MLPAFKVYFQFLRTAPKLPTGLTYAPNPDHADNVKRLVLVTHGERSKFTSFSQNSSYGLRDRDLSPSGIFQAAQIASVFYGNLADFPIDLVFSSPARECLETLQPIWKVLKASDKDGESRSPICVDNSFYCFVDMDMMIWGASARNKPIPTSILIRQFRDGLDVSKEWRHMLGEFHGENGSKELFHGYGTVPVEMLFDKLERSRRRLDTILICTHPLNVFAIRSVLLGDLWDIPEEGGFESSLVPNAGEVTVLNWDANMGTWIWDKKHPFANTGTGTHQPAQEQFYAMPMEKLWKCVVRDIRGVLGGVWRNWAGNRYGLPPSYYGTLHTIAVMAVTFWVYALWTTRGIKWWDIVASMFGFLTFHLIFFPALLLG
ncbi:hypothetical protein EJ04DRAFT_599746 [Polyplosphaeria fusca]|uniref:Histidine phosphatase superfamily n=1 Tax=Polyplosphaeria fusca TaxID=682080 RepID=A0A9P4R024_9PLEO|nr:hypothetical protein EJ04DRAFT_599746 [Polyplosphaeria fusca]